MRVRESGRPTHGEARQDNDWESNVQPHIEGLRPSPRSLVLAELAVESLDPGGGEAGHDPAESRGAYLVLGRLPRLHLLGQADGRWRRRRRRRGGGLDVTVTVGRSADVYGSAVGG